MPTTLRTRWHVELPFAGSTVIAFRPSFRLSVLAFALLAALAPGASAALPDPVRFGLAIENGDVRAARNWLDEGLPADYPADRIGTGLMIAAWEGNIEMMELFVARGASVNRANRNEETALMLAAWRGHADAVRWLLDRGARIDRPGLAWSALHYAVFNGHDTVARLLIERGANVNARSTNGSSALMMAAREGKDKVAKLLIERGADPNIRNDRGEDAFVWAMRNGHPRIAREVGTPERVAAAARAPESYGPPTASRPVPTRLEDLMREMRVAESEGRLTPELQAAYLAAVRDLRKASAAQAATESAARADVPRALEIRARRAQPGEERATLLYDGDRTQDLPPPARRQPAPVVSVPAAPPPPVNVVEPRVPAGIE
jgi:hypothetical protein